MKLIEAQWLFLKNLADLIYFIESRGCTASGGELQRTLYQQQEYVRTGKSKTLNSMHIHKLAADLAIFKGGKWLQTKAELQEFGDYWEALDPDNEWGGNWRFQDCPHFQRRLPKNER